MKCDKIEIEENELERLKSLIKELNTEAIKCAEKIAVNVNKTNTRKRLMSRIYQIEEEKLDIVTEEVKIVLEKMKDLIALQVVNTIKELNIEDLLKELITQVNIEIFPTEQEINPLVTLSSSSQGYL